MRDYLEQDYFEWLYDKVCGDRFSSFVSFRRLLETLHSIKFTYTIPRDFNRAEDGLDLRRRFTKHKIEPEWCSVLEMMVALAVRCEEDIMDDTAVGDRTSQWFWNMISSLGLNSMTDDVFDKSYVRHTIESFLDREYEPNGEGGLFTIRNCTDDLRDVEIWVQMLWYLDSIT